ncbi:MAG: DMT family transporter [Thalassotalea sp.]|nr:DMT family transporter [Thalassotalea sp.]
MTISHLIQLISLAAIWGSSFMFMRVAAPEIGPVALIFFRAAIGFITLLPFLFLYKQQSQVIKHWKSIAVVGLTNTALPFVLFAFATLSISAGLTSVLNATAPIFTALVAFVWLKEKLGRSKVIGLLIGFSGVLFLFISKGNLALDAAAIAIIAALVATLNYGYAACYTKQHLSGVSSLAIAAGSQLFASIMLLPFLGFNLPVHEISNTAIYSTITLGVVCTALAYIFYFNLLANLGPAKAITVTYLIPVFGIFWGMVFLHEQTNASMLIGATLILAGVSLTTGLIKTRLLTRLFTRS